MDLLDKLILRVKVAGIIAAYRHKRGVSWCLATVGPALFFRGVESNEELMVVFVFREILQLETVQNYKILKSNWLICVRTLPEQRRQLIALRSGPL